MSPHQGAGAAAACRDAAYSGRGACRGKPRLYRNQVDLADQILGTVRISSPRGGSEFWIEVSARGGDEAATGNLQGRRKSPW